LNPCGYATEHLGRGLQAAWTGAASRHSIRDRRDAVRGSCHGQKLKGRFVELLIAPGSPRTPGIPAEESKDIRLLDIGSLVPASNRKVYSIS